MARFGKRETRRPPFPADFGYDGLRAPDKPPPRDAEHRGPRFKLWSPNSSRLPVYPGLPPADFNMTPPFRYPPSGTHSLPPRPSHTHDVGSDTYHGGSNSLDLDSCQMTRRQSTIMPILSYKELCHDPSSSRFVVVSGIGTTAAEIAASLRKPIMPGPEFSGCNVFVRACARLPIISEDEQEGFVIECGSEQDAALVCRLVHGQPIGDTIASARLASDNLIQTVALQPCDHPPSIITSHLPPLPQRHSSSTKASRPDRRRSRQRANSHPLNYRPYQRLVPDGDTRNYAEGTQHVPSRSRLGERVQDRAANNAAARVRIAKRQARPNSRLESQMSHHLRALGSLVDRMSGSSRPGL
jgi:hypothetical protein